MAGSIIPINASTQETTAFSYLNIIFKTADMEVKSIGLTKLL